MSQELIGIIGILIVIIGTGVALATLILSGQRSMNVRMDRLEARLNQRMDQLEARMDRLEARIGRLETELRERMAHLDGLLEGLREAMFHRAPPAIPAA